MVDEPNESDVSPGADASHESDDADESSQGIVRTRITADPETAEYELLELVAAQDDRDIESLPSFYEQVGHFVEMLFRHPPSSEAQMELSFSYAGYRIRLTQLGQVTILKVRNSMEE